MGNTKAQVSSFLEKCEDLKKSKFIMATTKIKDLLKCIVNCPELYKVFEAVTKDFNYPFVKSKCLVTVNDGFNQSFVVLPQTVGHRLAFIFCLFVEIDRETINFNDFLQRYFPEDGSYFASYQAFCNLVVKGLEDAIAQVFREELSAPDEPENPSKSEMISVISLAIEEEKAYIASNSSIPQSDKEGGTAILNELIKAVRAGDEQLIDALICGYNYFVLYHRSVSAGVETLIKEIAAFEQTL